MLGCSGLAQVFACGANGRIAVFRQGGESVDPCDRLLPGNPFLAKNDEFILVYQGAAQITTSVTSTRQRDTQGTSESQRRSVTLPLDAIVWETGLWVLLELYGDILGGLIVDVTRDVPGLVRLTVDTGKPVPFSPTLVLFPDWARSPQS